MGHGDTDIILNLRRRYRLAIIDFCQVAAVVDVETMPPEVDTVIGRYFDRDPESGHLTPKD